MNEQLLFDLGPRFGGKTIEPVDVPRLTTHLEKVKHLMKDGRWRTLKVIAITVGCSEAGASARLRDLRKAWGGSHIVERRRVAESGLYEYRVI